MTETLDEFPFGPPAAPATGWRAAPDCGRCNDTGRYEELSCAATALVPEMCAACADMRKPFGLRTHPDHEGHRAHHSLRQVSAHCGCKRGRRMSELWYADKHGLYHPDMPEPDYDPEPEDYDA